MVVDELAQRETGPTRDAFYGLTIQKFQLSSKESFNSYKMQISKRKKKKIGELTF